MRIEPNSSVPDPIKLTAAKTKAPTVAPEQSSVDFAASGKLVEQLKNTPEVRADKIAAAKALVNDPNYPDEATLRSVANNLAAHIKLQSAAE